LETPLIFRERVEYKPPRLGCARAIDIVQGRECVLQIDHRSRSLGANSTTYRTSRGGFEPERPFQVALPFVLFHTADILFWLGQKKSEVFLIAEVIGAADVRGYPFGVLYRNHHATDRVSLLVRQSHDTQEHDSYENKREED
jgi:hypothetical protein